MVAARPMRILVIEDEARILAFLARALEADGFTRGRGRQRPRRVSSGRCAARYDLVILDLLLPGLDGLSVLRELQPRDPDLPVLILSARSDLPRSCAASISEPIDYLAKPFALRRAARAVRVQLRRARRATTARP